MAVSIFRLRARVGFSIHHFLWPARLNPRLWICRPSFERQRDFNPPQQCAAQRTCTEFAPNDQRIFLCFRSLRTTNRGATVTSTQLRREGIEMIAPHTSRRKRKTQGGRRRRRFERRWIVERFFAWIQWRRRLLVRWEYYPRNFLGFVQLTAICILLRQF